MKTRQVNLRLESALIRSLEHAAAAESLDRGTMMRKLLLEALSEWRLKYALRRYQAGDISIGRACEDSGRSHWELLDLIRSRGIAYRFNADEALERIRPLLKERSERVAEAGAPYDVPSDGRKSGRAATAPPRRDKGITENTLPDLPPRPGGVLLVGCNPAPASVARGHYYQGKLGPRTWKRLESVGLLTNAVLGQEDEALVAAGHGLTNLVKRVTSAASELSAEELRAGGEALRARIHEWQPRMVVFVFKQAAIHALGRRDVAPGACGEIAGTRAFLLPGPYARKAFADRVYEELRRLLA